MDLKDMMDQQAENQGNGNSQPASVQAQPPEVLAPVSAYGGAAPETPKKKRHILPWIITGSVLFLAVIIACVFLLLPKDSGKKEAFGFIRDGKTYLCIQGHEEPLLVPGDADSLDKGVYINAAKDTLLMLDENGKLSYMPLTDSAAEEGAQKIAGSVSDACFWRDSIFYIKDSSLYQYSLASKEETEMVSAVSSFIPYGNKEEAESFLITRKDESSWLYDTEEEDFIKIAESGDEVESVFPDGKSVYVNKEGDLYKCQIGREDELVLEDCGNVEKVTQEGHVYFCRELKSAVSFSECLEDDLLDQDAESAGIYVDERNAFRDELNNQRDDIVKKVLYYYDGNETVKVADFFSGILTGLTPDSEVIYYQTEGIHYVKMSELTSYTTDAFLEMLNSDDAHADRGFGVAVSGKVSENFTGETLGLEEDRTPSVLQVNENEGALYCLGGSTLYRFSVEKNTLGKPEKIAEGVLSYCLNEEGQVFLSKADEEEVSLYKGEEKIAENIDGFSLLPAVSGDGFVFQDMSETLYTYVGGQIQEIDKKVDGGICPMSSSYIAYLRNYDTEAESGTLYVYMGGEPVKVQVGVSDLFEPAS